MVLFVFFCKKREKKTSFPVFHFSKKRKTASAAEREKRRSNAATPPLSLESICIFPVFSIFFSFPFSSSSMSAVDLALIALEEVALEGRAGTSQEKRGPPSTRASGG